MELRTIFSLFFTACIFAVQAQIVPAPTDKQMEQLEKVMAPQRLKVVGILEADKTGQYTRYKTDLNAAAKETDRNRRQALLEQLKRDHYSFIQKAYAAAGINNATLKRQVVSVLGHSKFQMDEFGGLSSVSFLPLEPLPLLFTKEMIPPFNTFEQESNQGLAATCKANANDGAISLSSRAEFVGGCLAKGSTGSTFELSVGPMQKITISAQFDADASLLAAALAGYARVGSKFGVRLRGPALDKIVIVREMWLNAPLIWFNTLNFESIDFLAQANFTGSFQTGVAFKAQAYNETRTLAVPAFGACIADSHCTHFDFVRILATN